MSNPENDGLTKIDHVKNMLQGLIYQKLLPFDTVLMDTAFEFGAGICGSKLPVNFMGKVISGGIPSGNLSLQGWKVRDVAVKAFFRFSGVRVRRRGGDGEKELPSCLLVPPSLTPPLLFTDEER